jgi:hypothetical protein
MVSSKFAFEWVHLYRYSAGTEHNFGHNFPSEHGAAAAHDILVRQLRAGT